MPETGTFCLFPLQASGDERLQLSDWEILHVICSHFNGNECHPSVDRLSKMTRLSRRSVHRVINRLRVYGYIKRISGASRGRSNSYVVIFQKPSSGMTSIMASPPVSPMMSEGYDIQNGIEVCHPTCHTEETKEEKPQENSTLISQIYATYPRKAGGKERALTSIHKAVLSILPKELLALTQEYAASVYVQTAPRQMIPHATTWFNQRRWETDREEWQQPYQVQHPWIFLPRETHSISFKKCLNQIIEN
ncbi:MAG: helix-turn-helix domain-containing protein [bacterium]